MAKRVTGTVKWFDSKKGYGFIACDSGEDVFVHYSQIDGIGCFRLEQGQRVKFTMIRAKKGLQARDVAWMA